MGQKLTNEKGLTLVELLATISIASLLIIMITSAHVLVQNQFNQQQENIEEINNISYVLKQITNDFRRANPDDIGEVSDHSIKLGDIEYKWDEEGKTIQKNGTTIVKDINRSEEHTSELQS